jgi:hypothetical protein
MECFGKYHYLDGNILPVTHEEEMVPGEVLFYEVIRTSRGVPLFFDDHMKRLHDGISTRYDLRGEITEIIAEGLEALVRQETFTEINVRITVSFTGQEYSVHICYISSVYPEEETVRSGVPLIFYRAERFDPAVKLLNNRLRLSVNDALLKKEAYEALLGATSTPWAPWTVVPSDSKTHRNLMIATLVRDTLKSLDLRYPPSDPALKGLRID